MTTVRPPAGPAPAPGRGLTGREAPPVVAVVVTRNPGPFLEECLTSLGDQDYPDLSVLVVDAGSVADPTGRVGRALPSAFVRRLSGSPGFGGAANEAFAAVHGATFVLVCHDDVAFDPPAVRLMVEEAFRSNAAIVAPKLVDADDPSVLLETGRAIDRLGGSHTGIEPGELDQEQHDAVRDVFFVSSAAMLIRADLFAELGGFDPDTFPGAEDLDLCWRARLAGGRVLVAPDARAKHRGAAAERGPDDAPTRHDLARHRVRVLLTCYSAPTLLWVVPLGIAVSSVEALALAATRRRAEGAARFGAWWWNLAHLGAIRRARRRAQSMRRVHDHELHELQVGVGASIGAFLTQHHADERVETLGERGRDALEAVGEALRNPASILLVALVAFVLLGSRDLFSHGVRGVGDLVPWTGVRSLATELSSAWRHTGLGSTEAAPPALAMMAGLGTVLVGSVGLAHTLVVVGSLLVGSIGAFWLGRGIQGSHGAAAVTAVVYGISAAPRNAIANGRLGPLVLFALAPAVVLLLVRAGGFAATAGTSRRPLLGLAIVVALAAAWYPPAMLVAPGVAVVLLLVSPIAGGAVSAVRALGAAAVAVAGAAVLLAPWSATVLDLGSDRSAVGLSFRPRLDLVHVLRFETGPNGAGFAAWGLLVAAGIALVIAEGPRLRWAVRGWALALAGFAAVEVPAALTPGTAVPAPEAALAIAALGLAVAAGVGAGELAQLVARARIGRRQALGAVGMAGVAFASFGFVADTFDGAWRASDGWGSALGFTQDKQFEGEFRILWLGDPAVLPVDPVEIDAALSYSLTRNGPGDAREILRAPETDADRDVVRAVSVARRGETSRLGRMLAPAGVRYVALASRNGPDGARGRVTPGLRHVLADQLDLARLGSPPGLVLYENQSWAPARAVLPGVRSAIPTRSVDPLRAAVGVDLARARRLGSRPAPAGTVLLAEAYDNGWRASANGKRLVHGHAFGLTNSWTLPTRANVEVTHVGQTKVYGLLALEAALWVVALVWWSRGRRSGRPRAATTRPTRRPRRDFADDLVSMDEDLEDWDRL